MYEAMRRADYFLPLLDPGNPAHNRYTTTGVTGSAQLVYGFAKIPVIHEKFASFYGFNDRNALLYREETLGGAAPRHQADGRGIRRNAAGASPTGQGY